MFHKSVNISFLLSIKSWISAVSLVNLQHEISSTQLTIYLHIYIYQHFKFLFVVHRVTLCNFGQYIIIRLNHYHRFIIPCKVWRHIIHILLIMQTIFAYYAGIMLNAFTSLLCSKLCWHNRLKPTESMGRVNGINKDVSGAKLLPTTVSTCPVDWVSFCHLLKTQHCCLCHIVGLSPYSQLPSYTDGSCAGHISPLQRVRLAC